MTPDALREHAEEARESARIMTDPLAKARLHDIANTLESLAQELESRSGPDRRG